MQIESTFSVIAPIDEVWETLMDFDRVAGCVPGAQVLAKLSDDSYQVGMKVKLGPVSMQYKGVMTVVERDTSAHRAVFEGRAQETRGQGTANGSAVLSLSEENGQTVGFVSADVALSGKVAAMGKSVIGGVTDQMMALFATNLQTMLSESPTDEPAPTEDSAADTVADPVADTPAEGIATAAPAPATLSSTSPARSTTWHAPGGHAQSAPADASLDAVAFIKGMVSDRLSNPRVALPLLAAVAFLAYRLGRRAGRRTSDRDRK